MANPFTPPQFKILEAAFYGVGRAAVTGPKWRTYDKLNADGLVHFNEHRCLTLSDAGLRAYVVCERRDADSGCIAYQQRAQEARARLADQVSA